MEANEKKNYELSFLVNSEEDAHEAVKILNSRGAVIVFEGPLKKIEGVAYFGFFHFQCEPEHLMGIEESLRLNGKILRHLVVTPPISPRTNFFPGRRAPHQSHETKVSTPGVVSNEELEEKLEEILK